MSKKTKTIVGFMLVAVLVLVWKSRDERNADPASKKVETPRGSKTFSAPPTPEVAPLKKTDYRRLASEIKKHRLEYESRIDQDDENPLDYLTEEQIERGKLHTKTDPYFWEMAPGIIKELWESQEPNSDWTKKINDRAEDLLSSDEQYQGTTLSSVDCRESLCKIRFTHEAIENFNSFKESDMDQGPWIAGAGNSLGGFEKTDSGELSTYIYFTAPGDSETFFAMREVIAERQNLL